MKGSWDGGFRLGVYLAAVAVAAATAGVYWNVLNGGFVFDDNLVVVEDARIREPLSSAWRMFIPRGREVTHRPLRTFSYLLDYRLAGLDPLVFHASNIVYHTLASWLALALALRLTRSLQAATATAAIFALHPVQTDAVSYISGRRDVLCGLFFLLTLFGYLRYREEGAKRWLIVVFTSEILALMSKEMAATLPAMLLLIDIWHEPAVSLASRLVSSLRSHGGLYLVSILLCGLCLFGYYGGRITSEAHALAWYGGSPASNFATAAQVWVYYVKLFFWPSRLIADYSGWFDISTSVTEPRALLSFVGVACLLTFGAYLLRRRSTAGFGILWFGVTLLPVCHLIPYHELMAEHYLYLPIFGLALATASVFGSLSKMPRARTAVATAIGVCLLGALAARTHARNQDWHDPFTFYTTLTRDNPQALRGHLGMAVTLLRAGLRQAAMHELQEALELDSNDPRTLLNLGIAAYQIGWGGEAERLYREALAERPDYPEALNNLALLCIEQERYQEARPLLEAAAAVTRSLDPTVLATFGLFYEMQGKKARALSYYEAALRLRPDRELLRHKVQLLSTDRGSGESRKGKGDQRPADLPSSQQPGILNQR